MQSPRRTKTRTRSYLGALRATDADSSTPGLAGFV